MGLLRFATAGSVDDGKSTLIGRLLLDSKQIFEDQLEAVERTSRDKGFDYTNLALLTDGLRAEREQGITIDVAYRSFATPRRRFILADCPGHAQYTRNMVTGASTADLALLLVDARAGLTKQSRRHAAIAYFLLSQCFWSTTFFTAVRENLHLWAEKEPSALWEQSEIAALRDAIFKRVPYGWIRFVNIMNAAGITAD